MGPDRPEICHEFGPELEQFSFGEFEPYPFPTEVAEAALVHLAERFDHYVLADEAGSRFPTRFQAVQIAAVQSAIFLVELFNQSARYLRAIPLSAGE